ncbi:MAG: peptidase M22 [Clostridiales bacterium]|nr:peptidase M22 [Clostridiales bacterium]
MSLYLGIDTSNYTTSLAAYDSDRNEMISLRRMLPVKEGERGVRQNEAVFLHTQALPDLFSEMASRADMRDIAAVGCSDRPCDEDGSYFPCFTVGIAAAREAGALSCSPVYANSHQQGHIAAVLFSAGRTDLINETFTAFHVSGGTTQAVLVTPDEKKILSTRLLASSLDLCAGQAVDRLGNMLSLPFPSGKYVEELASKSAARFRIRPFMRDGSPSISGLENKCRDMLSGGEAKEDVCLYCLKYIEEALSLMLEHIQKSAGAGLPVVFSGGVMSDAIIRQGLSEKYDCIFGKPEYSTDNAAGTAYLTYLKHKRGL